MRIMSSSGGGVYPIFSTLSLAFIGREVLKGATFDWVTPVRMSPFFLAGFQFGASFSRDLQRLSAPRE